MMSDYVENHDEIEEPINPMKVKKQRRISPPRSPMNSMVDHEGRVNEESSEYRVEHNNQTHKVRYVNNPNENVLQREERSKRMNEFYNTPKQRMLQIAVIGVVFLTMGVLMLFSTFHLHVVHWVILASYASVAIGSLALLWGAFGYYFAHVKEEEEEYSRFFNNQAQISDTTASLSSYNNDGQVKVRSPSSSITTPLLSSESSSNNSDNNSTGDHHGGFDEDIV